MKRDLLEIIGVIILPIIIFYVAYSLYPLDESETNFILSASASQISNISQAPIQRIESNTSYPAYVSSVVSLPMLSKEVSGKGVVKKIWRGEFRDKYSLIAEIESSDNKTYYVILIGAEDQNINMSDILDKQVFYQGVEIEKEHGGIVIAKIIVIPEKTSGKDQVKTKFMCIAKGHEKSRCREVEKETEEE